MPICVVQQEKQKLWSRIAPFTNYLLMTIVDPVSAQTQSPWSAPRFWHVFAFDILHLWHFRLKPPSGRLCLWSQSCLAFSLSLFPHTLNNFSCKHFPNKWLGHESSTSGLLLGNPTWDNDLEQGHQIQPATCFYKVLLLHGYYVSFTSELSVAAFPVEQESWVMVIETK